MQCRGKSCNAEVPLSPRQKLTVKLDLVIAEVLCNRSHWATIDAIGEICSKRIGPNPVIQRKIGDVQLGMETD